MDHSTQRLVHDAVMVCSGERCQSSQEVLDVLRGVVRLTSAAVLVRTECLGRCAGRFGPATSVVLQSTDARLRPVGSAAQVLRDVPVPLTASVATWLLRVDAAPAPSTTPSSRDRETRRNP